MATLFTKIINGEIPARFVHQDELCVAIHDIQPAAPTHILVIPKKEILNVEAARSEDEKVLGHLLLVAGKIARDLKLDQTGFRLVINNGKDGGQSVDHLHVHLLGGRPLNWPPG